MTTRVHHVATFFAQVEPEWGHAWGDQEKPVRSIKVVGITQKRPAKPKSGTVVVKLAIEIPDAAFYPLRPEATIIIPETLTQPHPVVVEALDPAEGAECVPA